MKSNNPEYEREEAIQHLGPHHIEPHSRGGGEGKANLYPNRLWLPASGKHKNWHVLFSNLVPEEVIRVILEYTKKDGTLRDEFFAAHFRVEESWERGNKKVEIHKKINRRKVSKRKEAWQVVFDGMNSLEAIEWIEREFILKAWLDEPRP